MLTGAPVASVANALRAAFELLQRDPEAQRIATAARVEARARRRADRDAEDDLRDLVELVTRYEEAIAWARDRRARAADLRAPGARRRPRRARRARALELVAALWEARARGLLLGILRTGVTEEDLEQLDRILEAEVAG